MKIYLGNKKLYVKNEDNFIYQVTDFEAYDGYNHFSYNLELVAGWDYVNPDENDIQGWCPSENFIEEVQSESLVQYFMEESLKECLEENNFEILENISSSLQKIIDGKNHEEYDDDYYTSSSRGDYSPSNPWDAEGMSIKDFL